MGLKNRAVIVSFVNMDNNPLMVVGERIKGETKILKAVGGAEAHSFYELLTTNNNSKVTELIKNLQDERNNKSAEDIIVK